MNCLLKKIQDFFPIKNVHGSLFSKRSEWIIFWNFKLKFFSNFCVAALIAPDGGIVGRGVVAAGENTMLAND